MANVNAGIAPLPLNEQTQVPTSNLGKLTGALYYKQHPSCTCRQRPLLATACKTCVHQEPKSPTLGWQRTALMNKSPRKVLQRAWAHYCTARLLEDVQVGGLVGRTWPQQNPLFPDASW